MNYSVTFASHVDDLAPGKIILVPDGLRQQRRFRVVRKVEGAAPNTWIIDPDVRNRHERRAEAKKNGKIY